MTSVSSHGFEINVKEEPTKINEKHKRTKRNAIIDSQASRPYNGTKKETFSRVMACVTPALSALAIGLVALIALGVIKVTCRCGNEGKKEIVI